MGSVCSHNEDSHNINSIYKKRHLCFGACVSLTGVAITRISPWRILVQTPSLLANQQLSLLMRLGRLRRLWPRFQRPQSENG